MWWIMVALVACGGSSTETPAPIVEEGAEDRAEGRSRPAPNPTRGAPPAEERADLAEEAAPPPSDRPPAPAEPSVPSPGDEGAAEAEETRGVRGMLSQRGERAVFTPCGEEQARPLRDPDHRLKGAAMTDGTPAYVELHLSGPSDAPKVERLLRADPSGATRACGLSPREGWWAHGNEPFWSFRQTASGTTWSTPDREIGLGPLRRQEEAMVARAGAHVAILHVKDTGCQDDMSGERFSHAAELRFQRQTWRGCAAAPLDPAAKLPRSGPVEPGPEHR